MFIVTAWCSSRSRMAAASAASFLPASPDMRYGVMNVGAICRTVWPLAWNSRAWWCAPEQASMPIRQGGSAATSSINLPRTTLGLIPPHRTACGVHPMQDKDVLGEIDSQSHNDHGLPLTSNQLMRYCTFHRGTDLPVSATARIARDVEVPFIR